MTDIGQMMGLDHFTVLDETPHCFGLMKCLLTKYFFLIAERTKVH